MKKVVIVGVGSYANQVIQWLFDMGKANGEEYFIHGFLSADSEDTTCFEKLKSYKYLGEADRYRVEGWELFINAIVDPLLKKSAIEPLLSQKAEFINVIHPSATVADSATVGVGNVFFPNVTVSANAYVGDFVTILFSGMGHDAYAGNYVTIESQCDITGGVHLSTGVKVENGSIIIPHKSVGEWACIAQGSVVVRNVKSNTTVSGNPALIKKL